MRTLAFALAVAATLSPAAAAQQPAFRVAQLGWLAGTWQGETADGLMEEQWLPPRGGTMLATSRITSGDKTVFVEFVRLLERGGEVFYAVSIGERTTEFRLVKLEGESAVFENPKHDFPQRILYRRKGNTLLARIEGTRDGRAAGEDFVLRAVPCAAGAEGAPRGPGAGAPDAGSAPDAGPGR
ncbi:MAG: DUF6265 family protein, partial [Myxococcales bacterium]